MAKVQIIFEDQPEGGLKVWVEGVNQDTPIESLTEAEAGAVLAMALFNAKMAEGRDQSPIILGS